MDEKNNFYHIEGIIYSKPIRTVVSKKKKTEGQSFDFPSIILECKKTFRGTEYTTLPEFEVGKGVNLDDFCVKDKVEITFVLEGKKISDTFHKTSAKALYLRHTDIQGNDSRDVTTQRETVFVPPTPDGEDDGMDSLPF